MGTRSRRSRSKRRWRQSFLDYAMSVIVSRALPDVRDGLKPVHRRIVWGMFDQGVPTRPQPRQVRARRRATSWASYHPHGDQCDLRRAGAHSAQDFSMRQPARRPPRQLRFAQRLRTGSHRATPNAGSITFGDVDWSRASMKQTVDFVDELRRHHRAGADRYCRRDSRTCSSTAARASPSVWRPTSRRTTWARSSTRWSTSSTTPKPAPTSSWGSSKAPTSPPGRTSWAAPASSTPTAPGRGSVKMRAVCHHRRERQGPHGDRGHRAAVPNELFGDRLAHPRSRRRGRPRWHRRRQRQLLRRRHQPHHHAEARRPTPTWCSTTCSR